MSRRFGWCSDGHHDACPATIRPFHVEQGQVVAHPDARACECECHAS